MSEVQAKEIADTASVIVNGYAMLRDGSNIRIVNLNSGHVTICSEATIALDRLRANRQFMDE